MKRRRFPAAFALAAIFLGDGCSSAPKNVVGISKLLPTTLRVRRPGAPGADPEAGPGGIDYRSQAVPSASFDCDMTDTLWKDMDFAAIRACLKTVVAPIDVVYRLKREPDPRLVLDSHDEKTPPCLAQAMPEIRVPREIAFQSPEPDGLSCYAARLDLEADELLGQKVPGSRFYLWLRLPLQPNPQDDDETRRVLVGWALSPFWDPRTNTVPSKVLTRDLCKACIGERSLHDPDAPLGNLWP